LLSRYGGEDVILGTTKTHEDGGFEYLVAELNKERTKIVNIRIHATHIAKRKILGRITTPLDKLIKTDTFGIEGPSYHSTTQLSSDMGGLSEAKPSTVDEQIAQFKALSIQHGVKIPFEVVDKIYAPDGGMAYGALFEHKVFFSKEGVVEDTGFHEFLHEAMQTPEIFDVLKGVNMPEIIKAGNKGKEPVNGYERNKAEENIQQMTREYILKNNKKGIPKILVDFIERLKILLTRIYRAFGGKVDVIKNFIRLMKYAKTENINRLKVTVNDSVYDKVTMDYVNGLKVLDFSKIPQQEAELSFLQIQAAIKEII